MPDDLRAIISQAVRAGLSDEDIQALAQEHARRATSDGPSVGGFASNVASNIGSIVSETAGMLRHPLRTAQAMLGAKDAYDQAAPIAGAAVEAGQRESAMPIGERARGIAEGVYNEPVSAAMLFAPGAKPRVNLQGVKAGAESLSTRLMHGAIKPNKSQLDKIPGVVQAGLDGAADNLSRVALREGINPLTHRGGTTLQRRIGILDDVRNSDIAAAPQVPVPGSGLAQLRDLRPVAAKYRTQSTPQADMADIRGVVTNMKGNPDLRVRAGLARPGARGTTLKDQTPNEMNALNKGDNRALQGKFGKANDAEIDTRKAIVGGRVQRLEEAVPGTKDIGQRMRDLIDLRNAGNIARHRGENRNLVGLSDIISLSAGRPEVLAVSTAMRPAAQAGLAGAIHRAGRAVPNQMDLTALYRAMLLRQLGLPDEPPHE